MALFHRIVVAIDDSTASQLALAKAVRLASESAAQLRVVHVLDLNRQGEEISYLAEYEDSERKSGQQLLQEASDEATKLGVRAETAQLEVRTLNDGIGEQILRDAGRWGADLLVLGTHGRRGVGRLLLGSVAEWVARRSTAPVLLVPGHTRPDGASLPPLDRIGEEDPLTC